MIKKIRFDFIALLALLLSTCSKSVSDSDSDIESIPSGAFKYSAYDSTGIKIVEGWFTLEFKDSTVAEGEWHFKKIGDPQNIGRQVGGGNLVGWVQGNDRIIINLNPGWIDNNVILDGDYSNNDILGTWAWATFAGVTNQGTFEAIKK